MGLPEPSATVGIKLASLAVHAEEALSPGGNAFDWEAIDAILSDPEVKDYLARLDALALIPKKRSGGSGS